MKLWNYQQLFDPAANTPNVSEDLLQHFQEILASDKDLEPRESSTLRAGYTYFGQFIDHDLSYLQQNDRPANPPAIPLKDLKNRRRPSLDLDSIYGAGMEDSSVPYDRHSGEFIMGHSVSGKERDLPRGKNFRALIADPRNDENLLVAQMQVLFMRLHNKIVKLLRKDQQLSAEQAFTRARVEVVQIYQHLILRDFARNLVHRDVYGMLMWDRRGRLSAVNQENPSLPIEFAGAAFRLHSMVRTSYVLRVNSGRKGLASLLTYQQLEEHRNNNYLQDEFIVDWRIFFSDGKAEDKSSAQFAMDISPHIGFDLPNIFNSAKTSTGKPLISSKNKSLLTCLEMNAHQSLCEKARQGLRKGSNTSTQPKFNLANRSIKRGHQLNLASAQQAIKQLKHNFKEEAEACKLGIFSSRFLDRHYKNKAWGTNTPLWLYCMLEAHEIHNGEFLGPLGGWIVLDTLMTAAENTTLPLDPSWTPAKSIIRKSLASNRPNLDFLELINFVNTHP